MIWRDWLAFLFILHVTLVNFFASLLWKNCFWTLKHSSDPCSSFWRGSVRSSDTPLELQPVLRSRAHTLLSRVTLLWLVGLCCALRAGGRSLPVHGRLFWEPNSMCVGGQKATSMWWSDTAYSERTPSSSCELALPCVGSAGWHCIGTLLLLLLALSSEQMHREERSKKKKKMEGIFALWVSPLGAQIPYLEMIDKLASD